VLAATVTDHLRGRGVLAVKESGPVRFVPPPRRLARVANQPIVYACVAAALVAPPRARATTPPESYPLAEAEPGAPSPVDPNLDAWLAQHADRPDPFGLEGDEWTKFLAEQDAVTQWYLKLTRARAGRDRAAAKALAAEAYQALSADLASPKPTYLTHPLIPYLLAELAQSDELPAGEKPKLEALFADVGTGSCAHKNRVFEEITRDNLSRLSDDGLRDLLARIERFRASSFKSAALRRFIAALPDARRRAVADRLVGLAAPYPQVLRKTPWLAAQAEKSGKLAGEQPEASFDEARRLASRRQCSKAKGVAVDAVKALPKKLVTTASLDLSTAVGRVIDACYKGRDPAARREFWKHFTELLGSVFGEGGMLEGRLRQAYIHWSANEYDEAKPLFAEIKQKTEEGGGKLAKYAARATFALARIAEAEGDADAAIALYSLYTGKYAKEENFEEALEGLVLLRFDREEWDAARQPLAGLIAAQSALPVDERSVSTLSFALFWEGRIDLAQNRLQEAAEMWRRVATEYYSTYYGAMGHYMLEQLKGVKLALEPARTPTFRMHALREAFAPEGRGRVKRVEALMQLGLKGEAICELEELDVDQAAPEKLLVKALFLHAAGHWLDAIKAYDALPRSFRGTLPLGTERIVFPRRFYDEVRGLAAKAEVDPDLVMAIIRQESVFNPAARSPVGAMGLMQLMPATAALEMKHLGGNYLTPEERKSIAHRLARPENLLSADMNLAIGVHHVRSLLAKFPSPVYVLSAYNASPAAAARWMNNISTKDILAFIERIPYKETRAYVKLVLRNYFYYKRWYGTPNDEMKHLDAVASPLIAMVKQEVAKAAPSN
jgi:hypothetical protein